MVDLSGIDRKPSLVDRAKAIILTPKEEWPRIEAEPSRPKLLVTEPGVGYRLRDRA